MEITMKRQFMRSVYMTVAMLIGSAQVLADDSPWKGGAHVYAKVCGQCHESGVGPVIKGRNLSLIYTKTIVRHGFRAMPAFRSSFLDDQALQSVVEYIGNSSVSQGKE